MNHQLGKKGEAMAAEYLRRKGYQIIKQNFYTRYGEVDIICTQGRDIIFVEVKTRSNTKFGFPEEAITYKKKQHIRKAALIYLNQTDGNFRELRFDVITILFDGEKANINHIENAF